MLRNRFVPSYCKKQEKRHRSFRATFYGRSISVHKINLVILRTDRVSRIFSPETLSLSKDDESSPPRSRFSRDIKAREEREGSRYSSMTSHEVKGPNVKDKREGNTMNIWNISEFSRFSFMNFGLHFSLVQILLSIFFYSLLITKYVIVLQIKSNLKFR